MKTFLTFLFALFSSHVLSQPHSRHFTVADGLPNNQIRQIMELPGGRILVETEGSFCLFNGERFSPVRCQLDSVMTLPVFGAHGHLWQGDSLLWLKDYYSLYAFDTRSFRFRYDFRNESALPTPVRQFIHENGDSLTHAKIRQLANYQNLLDTITDGWPAEGDRLQAYCQDRQGGQWLGTENKGILYLPPEKQKAEIVRPLKDDMIRRMMPLDDRLVLMAGETGIYLFDIKKKSVTLTLVEGNSINCMDMSKDNRGRVWISTKQGLYCYDQTQLLHYDDSNTTGLIHNHIRFALPRPDGSLLICNLKNHIGIFYPERRKVEMLNDRLPQLNNYRIVLCAAHTTTAEKEAVCTQNGFFFLHTRTRQIEEAKEVESANPFSRKYNCILLDKAGRLWIGTQNGLLMTAQGKTVMLGKTDGLSNSCIKSLAEDSYGNIWAGTSSGINRIKAADSPNRTFRIRILDTQDGIPDTEMMEGGVCAMPDNTMLFATTQGITMFPASIYNDPETTPEVTLVALSIEGEEWIPNEKTVQLKHNQNHLVALFSALNYANPHHTRYRYRLTGLEKEWNVMTDGKPVATIRYNALAPGTYTLECQASAGDNIWSESFSKTIVIHPPFWLTWWAICLYAALSLFLFSAAVRRFLKNKREKMERENDERVNQLFELREEARHQFAQSVDIKPQSITIDKEEEELVSNLLKAIQTNMDNFDYTVDQLARDIAMSRANLYKKMQSILGITPNDFIRNVRLKKAAQLLADTKTPVNQITLMVGFQTPRYFSQCFKKMFGLTPVEYREGRKENIQETPQ